MSATRSFPASTVSDKSLNVWQCTHDEPKLDAVLGVLQHAENHDGREALKSSIDSQPRHCEEIAGPTSYSKPEATVKMLISA
jgi:hypothetical protein